VPQTHEVFNQPPPFEDVNLFESDAALRDAFGHHGGVALAEMRDFGALTGAASTFSLGFEANRNLPELRTYDRFGRRIDEVAFHPAWHRLLEISTGAGLHA